MNIESYLKEGTWTGGYSELHPERYPQDAGHYKVLAMPLMDFVFETAVLTISGGIRN